MPGSIYGVIERNAYTELNAELLTKENMPTNSAKISDDESKIVAQYSVALQEYMHRKAAEFIVEGKIDEGWDEFVSTVNKMGMDKILEVQQRVYDRFNTAMNGNTGLDLNTGP